MEVEIAVGWPTQTPGSRVAQSYRTPCVASATTQAWRTPPPTPPEPASHPS